MLGWYKQVHGDILLFWFQYSGDGWDTYAGSKFIVEFQLASEPYIGVGKNRKRLPCFLNDKQLDEMRGIQNEIIARLSNPPPNHPTLHISADISQLYLAKFKPITEPYKNADDVWLRYYSDSDVRRWAEFVLRQLPLVVAGFELGS